MKLTLLIGVFSTTLLPLLHAQVTNPLPAFPGAGGFGKYSQGGRGGVVIAVTNLNDSGPGSLREALTQELPGPRTIVFRVGGAIELLGGASIETTNSLVTIAGETAPGDGVYVRGQGVNFVGAHDIIIRDLAIRPGCNGIITNSGAFTFNACSNVIIDSCSASFAVDQNTTFRNCDLVTVQWSIISYALRGGSNSCHVTQASDHSCGMLIWNTAAADVAPTNRISVLHNLFSHCSRRTPLVSRQGPGTLQVELVGNAFYNWGSASEFGTGLQMECISDTLGGIAANIERNFYRYGPDTRWDPPNSDPAIRIVNNRAAPACELPNFPNNADYFTNLLVYAGGNRFQSTIELVSDQSGQDDFYSFYPSSGFAFSLNRVFTPAYVPSDGLGEFVAAISERAGAGASLIARGRDALDIRALWTFLLHQGGLIDHQSELFDDWGGNWPPYESAPAPVDSDSDGMPDSWEVARGSNPSNADGHIADIPGGYTRLELYLQSLRIHRGDVAYGQPNDLDGDGLPDDWEEANGINPSSANGDDGANGDPDLDGANNWSEWVAGTAPKDPSSLLKILDLVLDANTSNLAVQFPAAVGRTTRLERSSLLSTGDWQTATVVSDLTSNQLIWTTNAMDGHTNGFYRLTVPTP